jgi:hypothetical protein
MEGGGTFEAQDAEDGMHPQDQLINAKIAMAGNLRHYKQERSKDREQGIREHR